MHEAYVIEGEMLDNQTIHLEEPLTLKWKKVKLIIEKSENTTGLNRQFGILQGCMKMTDDFQKPLDDFQEYER